MNPLIILSIVTVGVVIGYCLHPIMTNLLKKRNEHRFKPVLLSRYHAHKIKLDELS